MNKNINWLDKKQKRKKFIITGFLVITVISIFVFFFGYDEPVYKSSKLIDFTVGCLFLYLLVIILANIIYKIPNSKKICKKCGNYIKDLEVDCDVEKIEYIGTVNHTEYKNVLSTVKGKTTYPRGAYSMRNDTLERTSESSYEINTQIPVNKKHYIYKIHYKCKKCQEHFITKKVESLESIDIKEN